MKSHFVRSGWAQQSSGTRVVSRKWLILAAIALLTLTSIRSLNAQGLLYEIDSTGDGGLVGSSNFCDDGTGHCTLRAGSEQRNRPGTGILWSDAYFAAKDFILGGTRSGTGVNRLSFFTGNPDTTLSGTVAINTGQWVHLAATRNGTTGQMRIYVNGLLDGTATGSTGLLRANDRINIGGNTLDARYLVGDIDDVRIYSRVLSGTEISNLSNQTTPRENYATWAVRTMAALPAAARAMDADPDFDGLPNFAEFAYWLNPLRTESPPQAATRGADGILRFTFRRR